MTDVEEKEILSLKSENEQLSKTIEEMKCCVLEYERTITQVMNDKGQTNSTTSLQVDAITAERDQTLEELSTVEKAFTDLHRRFEKSKDVIESYKKNEDTLKQCLEEYQQKLINHEKKYQKLKQHAEEKLSIASNEIEKVRYSSESEVTKLSAALKKSKLQIQILQSQIDQKTKENNELMSITDELISKCGTPD